MIAGTDADHLAKIHHTARLNQTAASSHDVVDQVGAQLVSLLSPRGFRFEYGTLLGHPPRLEQDGSIVWGSKYWDTDRDGLPGEEVELRVFAHGHFCGRFMLDPTPGSVPSLQARLVAVTLADQTGTAFYDTRRRAPNLA